MFRFSIKDILWLTLVVGLVIGWRIHIVERNAAIEAISQRAVSQVEAIKSDLRNQLHQKIAEYDKAKKCYDYELEEKSRLYQKERELLEREIRSLNKQLKDL